MAEPGLVVLRWGEEFRARPSAPGDGATTVVLHAGADERWLSLDAPERFAEWAGVVVGAFPGCRSWVTIRDLNLWPLERYVGVRTLATGRLLRSFDHQLAGHVLAAEVLTDQAPGSTVAVGLVPDDRAYELHDLFVDVLAAPARRVGRSDVGHDLRRRKAAFDAGHPATTLKRRLVRRMAGSAIPLDQALPRAVAAAYAAHRGRV